MEEIVNTNLITCDDASQSQNPTCGWYQDALGYVVPHSQVNLKNFLFIIIQLNMFEN